MTGNTKATCGQKTNASEMFELVYPVFFYSFFAEAFDKAYQYQCCFGKHNNFSISISFSINDKFILVLVLVLVKFNYNFSFSISFSNQKSNNISSSFSFSFSFSFSGRLFKFVEANACICQKNFPF